MPKGVYKRTKRHREISRENACKLNKLPKSEAHKKANRENMIKCHKEGKHLGHGFDKKPLMGQDIIKHHNDLKHGAERPDDVIYMSSSDHCRLHAKLQNNYIGINKDYSP